MFIDWSYDTLAGGPRRRPPNARARPGRPGRGTPSSTHVEPAPRDFKGGPIARLLGGRGGFGRWAHLPFPPAILAITSFSAASAATSTSGSTPTPSQLFPVIALTARPCGTANVKCSLIA